MKKIIRLSNNIFLKLFFLPFQFPEILFALLLFPSKFASLSKKLNIPPLLTLPNVICFVLTGVIIINLLSDKKFHAIPKYLIFLFAGFILLMVTGIFYSAEQLYGMEKTIEFITICSVACFAPFFILNNILIFERFLKVFLLIGFTLSVFIFIFSPYTFKFYEAKTVSAGFQTSIGSNYLGLQYILGIALLILVYYFMLKKNISTKQFFVYILLTALFAGALIYSPGKNPIISLFLTIIIMIFLSIKKPAYHKVLIIKKILHYATFMIIIGATLLIFIGDIFLNRFTAILTPGYYGQVERVENTKIAFDVFSNNPFFGAGMGSFAKHAAIIEGIDRMKYPHNLPLEIASEMGFVGLFLFFAMLFFAYKKLFYLVKKYRNIPSCYNLPVLVFACLTFTFLTSLTGGDINNPLLFAWIGISFVLEPLILKHLLQRKFTE